MSASDTFTIGAAEAGTRLDIFLSSQLADLSRSRIQEEIRQGRVTINGSTVRPSQVLRDGDVVLVAPPAPPLQTDVGAEDIPLVVLHEDSSLIVMNKPAGLVVHPGAGNFTGTVVNALLHHCDDLSSIGGVERPGIVHRLDKETSGCLVAAKNDKAHRLLSEQFAGREVEKTYLALVDGRPRMPHGWIDAPIGRHPVHRQKMAVHERGREAQTHYRVIASEGLQSLVECRPKTGRTHQIRVHLKHLGHSVIGDPIYGRRGSHTRHFLHAWKLAFRHPVSGKKVEFCSPLPSDFPAWAVAAAAAAPARGFPA